MNSRLARVQSWENLARAAEFRPALMAAMCSVSLRQLERFFLSQFGVSPGPWARKLRCDVARQLISKGWSSKAVAAELKFANASHLCRDFRRLFGFPPSSFAPMVRP